MEAFFGRGGSCCVNACINGSDSDCMMVGCLFANLARFSLSHMAKKKAFTMEEVAKHCTVEDCWIVVRRKVYDVTDFLFDHPAGETIILDCAGQDATEQFVKSAHSADAEDLLEEYEIGVLKSVTMFLSPFDGPRKLHVLRMGEYRKSPRLGRRPIAKEE